MLKSAVHLSILVTFMVMLGCSEEKPTSPGVPIISLSPDSLTFTASAGGANPPSQRVVVRNTGGGELLMQAVSLADWIKVETPPQRVDPDTIAVMVSTSMVPAGVNVDSIRVTSAGATNSPQFITVTFTVCPVLGTSPTELVFSAVSGGENPDTQSLEIINHGGGTMTYSTAWSASWLSLTKTSGDAPDTIGVSADITGLTGGIYEDTITVSSPQASNDSVIVPVTLTVSSWLPSDNGVSPVYDLQDLTILGNDVAWAVGFIGNHPGHAGVIIKSADGGINWTTEKIINGTEFGGVAFATASVGCVVGDAAVIVRTEDGGETWSGVAGLPIGDSLSLWTVTFAGPDTGWAVGTRGTIIRTTDQGATWEIQTSPPEVSGLSLAATSFVDNQNGWITGNSGRILRTTDGGDTWEVQARPTAYDLWGILFLDLNTGWVVGDNGVMMRTDDGGYSWDAVDVPTENLLHDVWFVTSTHAWAVGQSGTILHTSDGGGNWLQQFTETSSWLYAARFISAQTGLVVGQTGTVLRTTSGGF